VLIGVELHAAGINLDVMPVNANPLDVVSEDASACATSIACSLRQLELDVSKITGTMSDGANVAVATSHELRASHGFPEGMDIDSCGVHRANLVCNSLLV
jgi:hypothetical protein